MMKYTNVTQNPDGTYNIHYEDDQALWCGNG